MSEQEQACCFFTFQRGLCFKFTDSDLSEKVKSNELGTVSDWVPSIEQEPGFRYVVEYDPSLALDVELMSTSLIREKLASLSSLEKKPKTKKKTKKEESLSLLDKALALLDEREGQKDVPEENQKEN